MYQNDVIGKETTAYGFRELSGAFGCRTNGTHPQNASIASAFLYGLHYVYCHDNQPIDASGIHDRFRDVLRICLPGNPLLRRKKAVRMDGCGYRPFHRKRSAHLCRLSDALFQGRDAFRRRNASESNAQSRMRRYAEIVDTSVVFRFSVQGRKNFFEYRRVGFAAKAS